MGNTQRFKDALARLPTAIADNVRPVLMSEGKRLADAMVQNIQHSESGALAASVRVEPDNRLLRVYVRAGGQQTTKGGYDYALAEEFGTSKEPARPFFYTTYRALKRSIAHNISRAMVAPTDSKRRSG